MRRIAHAVPGAKFMPLDASGGAKNGRGYRLRRVMPPLRVFTETLAPPSPVENSSSFSGVYWFVRVGGGPKALSMDPLKVETEKSAVTEAGRAMVTEPLTVSASRLPLAPRPPSKERDPETVSTWAWANVPP